MGAHADRQRREAPKKKRAKSTRRAVRGRRSLAEQEDAASLLLDEWLKKMDRAMSRVKYYQTELKKIRRQCARQEAEAEDAFKL